MVNLRSGAHKQSKLRKLVKTACKKVQISHTNKTKEAKNTQNAEISCFFVSWQNNFFSFAIYLEMGVNLVGIQSNDLYTH
jgi:hypothetical protein